MLYITYITIKLKKKYILGEALDFYSFIKLGRESFLYSPLFYEYRHHMDPKLANHGDGPNLA